MPHNFRVCGIPGLLVEFRGRGIPASQPFSDFTANRNPGRTSRSLSAGGQFSRPEGLRACPGHEQLLGRRSTFRNNILACKSRATSQWSHVPPLKPGKEAKQKDSWGAPGNQFPLLQDAHKHPFPMLQARFTNCWRQVHFAFVPQARGLQGPSLGLWLADFGRELMKFQDWRPPILFFGFSFFWRGGGGVRGNNTYK